MNFVSKYHAIDEDEVCEAKTLMKIRDSGCALLQLLAGTLRRNLAKHGKHLTLVAKILKVIQLIFCLVRYEANDCVLDSQRTVRHR